MLALFFAAVALILAGVGLYGVLNYAVLERRRELGIRIALGATGADIARRVTVGSVATIAVGSAIGLGLGLTSERYIGELLYQVKATDPNLLALPLITLL
jgi:ABC-type antimicrobial peptide transport system permease subunit